MYAPVRNLERVRECALGLMVITTALFINSAHADTYNYVCTDHGKVLPPESRRQTEYPYMERKHLQNQKAVGLREYGGAPKGKALHSIFVRPRKVTLTSNRMAGAFNVV